MKRTKGFTLIELMIVVAIIAIIAAVGFPSYQNYIVQTNRTQCQSALAQMANAMERHYTMAVPSTYGGAGSIGAGLNTGAPTIFATTAPIDATATCDLTIVSATVNDYLLAATPIAGTLLAGDGMSTLNAAGQKCWFEGLDAGGDPTEPTECKPW
jgi:type IV pilus assembly protein PilE